MQLKFIDDCAILRLPFEQRAVWVRRLVGESHYWRVSGCRLKARSRSRQTMAPIQIIGQLPVFITKEQHADYQSTTPASGDFKHDPVLEHLERDVRMTLDPAIEGFDAIASSQLDVYVTESCVHCKSF